MQILVDSSVWIDFFNNVENDQTNVLTELFINESYVCICPVILQEVLQGITDDRDFNRIKKDLGAFDVLQIEPLEAALEAVNIYRKLRKKGVTIRRSNDCLIAQYAIFHKARILHKDRDFTYIAQHTELQLF
jgi:predicted nucleic acid-binding protein